MSSIDATAQPLYAAQFELEEEMRSMGIARFREQIQKAQENSTESRTQSVRRLLGHHHASMVEGIEAFMREAKSGKAGRRHSALKYFELVGNVDVLAHMTLRSILDSVTSREIAAKASLALSPQEALLLAAEANADPNARLKRLTSVSTREIKDKVAHLTSTWGSIWRGEVAPDNIGDMAATVQRLAENNAVLGLGAEKAVQRAVERVKQTHANVNGFWIDASDRRIPPGFPELAGAMADRDKAVASEADAEAAAVAAISARDAAIQDVNTPGRVGPKGDT